MIHDELIEYCLSKPGALLTYPFGPGSTVIKVQSEHSAARIFAQFFMLGGEPSATFNCDAAMGELLRSAYPGVVTRGYHCPPVQQPYFNTVRLIGVVPDAELRGMIDHAYAVVVGKLPKKYQKELGHGE
ncbi:MmcQ/YjbR family DNA-binding protein [Eubacteriales bacterium OttesenSCG-928-A19]|nr:MmcQ/YjbR family DNA-binding protein [Eubacteriales bacterium OttesenSCG-928-A19]